MIESVKNLRVTDDRFPDIRNGGLTDFYLRAKRFTETVARQNASIREKFQQLLVAFYGPHTDLARVHEQWLALRNEIQQRVQGPLFEPALKLFDQVEGGFVNLFKSSYDVEAARQAAIASRHPLDQKKLLDMLIDDIEDKYIELLEGTRAHTANIDNYIKQIVTALDDDFNTQFYFPSFREVRKASRFWDVQFGQIESTSVLTNNRAFAKVEPQATMEFDLPKRDILIAEAMGGAKALMDTYGALVQDPSFLALTKLRSGQPPSSPVQGAAGGLSTVRNVLPALPSMTAERVLSQSGPGDRQLAAPLEALIPDPAIYKFETGTGYEIRPVISPDGQSVVFHFYYMYTTNVREPVRADEKHLGRVKRHFVDTDVQLGNYELREISRYQVALKAARTSRGVPLLEDVPGVGILFRPLPSAEAALQENIILGQATVFPTLFDLMGLRWAPAVADLDPLGVSDEEFVVRGRRRDLMNRVFDYSTSRVDEFMRIPPGERRTDLYRTQETIPYLHPNGYRGPGLNLRDSNLREGYDLRQAYPESQFIPSHSKDGAIYRPNDGAPAPGLPGVPVVPQGPGVPFPVPPGAAPLGPTSTLPLDGMYPLGSSGPPGILHDGPVLQGPLDPRYPSVRAVVPHSPLGPQGSTGIPQVPLGVPDAGRSGGRWEITPLPPTPGGVPPAVPTSRTPGTPPTGAPANTRNSQPVWRSAAPGS